MKKEVYAFTVDIKESTVKVTAIGVIKNVTDLDWNAAACAKEYGADSGYRFYEHNTHKGIFYVESEDYMNSVWFCDNYEQLKDFRDETINIYNDNTEPERDGYDD